MVTYHAPGVYVEEVPSGNKPIAGVWTSTAGFIGVVADRLTYPRPRIANEVVGTGDDSETTFALSQYPVNVDSERFTVRVDGAVNMRPSRVPSS